VVYICSAFGPFSGENGAVFMARFLAKTALIPKHTKFEAEKLGVFGDSLTEKPIY